MKNKKLVLILMIITTVTLIVIVNSQIKSTNKIIFTSDMKTIQLKKPLINTKDEFIHSLNKRQSQKKFSDKELPIEILSELLWAVRGLNREKGGFNKKGGLTVPLLWNVNVHVAMKSGVYIYNPNENTLIKKLDEDIRSRITFQDYAHKAPAILTFSLDTADMTNSWIDSHQGSKDFFAGSMVSYISQNVYLYSAYKGLATSAMAFIDNEYINLKLELAGTEHTYLVHPIGYPEKEINNLE